MSRRLVLIVGVLLFAVLFLGRELGWLTADRSIIASTPTVRPFFQLAEVRVPGGEQLCIDGVTFEPDAQAAQVQARTVQEGGALPPLRLEATAPGGYRATAVSQAGGRGDTVLTIPFDAAPRTIPDGRVCLTNTGRRSIAFLAAGEGRSQSPARTTVDGEEAPVDVALTLLREQPGSILGNLGTVLDRITAFRPFPVGIVSVWVLAMLLVFGVPLAAAWVVQRAANEDEDRFPT
jgi:hypothetical protein